MQRLDTKDLILHLFWRVGFLASIHLPEVALFKHDAIASDENNQIKSKFTMAT